ncbi:MAG TPA: hypothetical protein VN775_06780 [Opitutaceae bacterium]|nr:hypothetical protein [Opitutaceae bacterium]
MRRLSVPVLAVFGSAVAAFGQGTLVGNSPFMPTGSAAGAGAGPGEAYELAGSSVQGSEVSVCIYERQAKHSQWIPVGGLSDGIHVISYDALHDKAVVTIGGAFKELTLRKTAIASLGPPSVPRPSQPANEPAVAPVASSAPAPAASPLQEQREARMLVSDLLEIGVQQRKAYQDAKQKAASGTPAQPAN